MMIEKSDVLKAKHDMKQAVEDLERKLIRDSLIKANWHRGKAAAMLNIPRRTLQRKMIKYGFRNIEN